MKLGCRLAQVALLGLAGCSHAPPPKSVEAVPAPAALAPSPAPRVEPADEVQVSGTLGSLDDEEIEGPFHRRWDEITACYQKAQEKLWYLGGRVEVRLRIDQSGAVTSGWVSSSSVGNYDAERCILEVARQLHFARPHGGPVAEFAFPLEFRGRSAVASWEESRITPSLLRHRHEVVACRSRASAKPPRGMTLTVYVAPGGKVTSAGLAADAPIDGGFADCLVAKVRAWRLDDPLGQIAKVSVGVRP